MTGGERQRGGRRRDERDAELLGAILGADPVVEPHIRRLVQDPRFEGAAAELGLSELSGEFQSLTDSITRYNDYHRRERRLWAIKLGKGAVPAEAEAALKREAHSAKGDFRNAFQSADRCIEIVERSGFKPLVNEHIGEIARRFAFDENTVIGEAADLYFRRIGCSTPMIEEFKHHYHPIDYDFIGVLGGGDLSGLREVARAGVEAQEEILDYTEKHGLEYLRGDGPPAWATTASNILAAAGISIGAWVIVVIVAVIMITLAIICAIFFNSFPPALQAGCAFLASIGLIPAWYQ